jgi:2-desacetyl-2-hydroxyethyl bacteriochlorophyllide A dehydrogenase
VKAIVCEQVGQFKGIEVPEPSPITGEAIVRIKRIGICGTDIHAFKGNQPFFTYPRILGHELSGIIEWIGDNDAGLHAGDQVSIIPYLHCGICIACRNGKTNCCTSMRVLGVHTDGGMREMLSVPVTHLLKANSLTLDQAAIVEPLSIGAHAVRRSALQSGETALVIGGGPIGLGVMAIAKLQGAKVIAMDIDKERLSFCKAWAQVDGTVHATENPASTIEELTNGEYPTVVFDATGNARSMSEAVRYMAHGGRLVYVGLVKGEIPLDDPEFHKREATLLGSRNATREDFLYVIDLIQEGRLQTDAYMTHNAPFEQMMDRFEDWLNPASKVIKAIVTL